MKNNNYNIYKIKFINVILIIHLMLYLLIISDIFILRQIIGFIYLTFIPGFIILKVLKLDKITITETILFSVGLSISFLMFMGAVINTLYPPIGISEPISTLPLIITISIGLFLFCILGYKTNKEFNQKICINPNVLKSPQTLFFILLPFLGIFGAYFINFNRDSLLLFLLIILIALIMIFNKYISENLYPLCLVSIALALLLSLSLIGLYLPGFSDTHIEYYFHKLVVMNFFWDSTISSNVNAMLATVMLPTIYSFILDVDGEWIFRIAYPFVFSLLPLGLYQAYQQLTNKKTAFLSVLFFMSFPIFYKQFPYLMRQEIAEFFLVLLLLLMVSKKMNLMKRSALFIIFAFGLVTSHYGTSYIFMFCVIFLSIFLFLIDNLPINAIRQSLHSKFKIFLKNNVIHQRTSNPIHKGDRTLTTTIVVLYIVFILTWYMYVSSSSAFNTIINIGDHVYSSLYTDFLNPAARESNVLSAIGMGPELKTLLQSINRFIFHTTEFFILVGVIALIGGKFEKLKDYKEYCFIAIASMIIILASIVLPRFSGNLHMDRLYHVTLIFLSPFFVLGGQFFISCILKLNHSLRYLRHANKVNLIRNHCNDATNKCIKYINIPIIIVLILYFLFNSGFVFVIAENLTSFPLGINNLDKYGSDKDKAFFCMVLTIEQDVFSAKWLSKNVNYKRQRVYADDRSRNHALLGYGMIPPCYSSQMTNTTKLRQKSYVYLRYSNIAHGIMSNYGGGNFYDYEDITPLINKSSKIYSNEGSEIYYYE